MSKPGTIKPQPSSTGLVQAPPLVGQARGRQDGSRGGQGCPAGRLRREGGMSDDIRARYGFSFFEWTQILAGHYGLTAALRRITDGR
jgi:hypothetical protein